VERPFAACRGDGADGCVGKGTAAGRLEIPVGHVWGVHGRNVALIRVENRGK
jgi:hypothetical protein